MSPMKPAPPDIQARMRTISERHAWGIFLMRERLRRENPGASKEVIGPNGPKIETHLTDQRQSAPRPTLLRRASVESPNAMNALFHWLKITTDMLEEAHVSFGMVGGLAVSVHCQPRTTHDAKLEPLWIWSNGWFSAVITMTATSSPS